MKNLFKVFVVVLIPVVFYLVTGFFSSGEEKKVNRGMVTSSSLPPPPPQQKDFRNFIWNFDYDSIHHGQWVSSQLDWIKNELHFNGVQIYGGNGSNRYGRFIEPLNGDQIYHTNLYMDSVGDFNLKGLYGRTKIEKLCYGQRLIYEAEGGNNDFSYSYKMNPSTQDGERWIVKATADSNSAGILCENITENLQHSDIIDYNFNSTGTWYLKPLLKIKQSDFSPDDTTEVVRIEVRNFSNEIIATKKIRVRNFRNDSLQYNGDYINKFDFTPDPGMDLLIDGRDSIGCLNHNRGLIENPFENNIFKDSCHVDFKIYWCGNVDVYFDKLIVDDEMGNAIFNLEHDDKIYQEVSNFTNNSSNLSFYADEVKYSNFECIKHVISVMKSVNSSANLTCVSNQAFNYIGYRNVNNVEMPFLNLVNWKYVIFDVYQFYAESKSVPNNLTQHDERIPSSWFGVKDEYNAFLLKTFGCKTQYPNNTYYGSYIYMLNKLRTDLNGMQNKPELIFVPQLMADLRFENDFYIEGSGTSHYSGGFREPTNEELEAQAMLAIAYGVDHLGWFVYSSAEWSEANGDGGCYFGLINKPDGYERREMNMYHQNKYQAAGVMNQKILKFKPYLDNSNWVGAYSVHAEGANHYYINDIRSIFRNTSGGFEDASAYRDDTTSWEMGFYEPINSTNDYTKYLIMVNRRCYPEISNNDGDKRYLKIKFNPNAMAGFNNWKLTDVNTGASMIFDKNTGDFVDFGANLSTFLPGEGKLFKLAPVSNLYFGNIREKLL